MLTANGASERRTNGHVARASQRPRRALILAAGSGRRLLPHTRETPKCMLDLGGWTVLEQQIGLLRAHGVDDIVMAVGFQAELLRSTVEGPVTFVPNELYAETNSIYSLWLAREYLDEPCLVLNGDVLFGERVLNRILDSPFPDAVVYDSASGTDPEETKVRVGWHGRLVNIGKTLNPDTAHGEYLGIMRLSAAGARALRFELERLITVHGLVSAWAPEAVRRLLPRRPVFGVDVAGEPWIEIDFTEDLQRAREEVLPRLRQVVGED